MPNASGSCASLPPGRIIKIGGKKGASFASNGDADAQHLFGPGRGCGGNGGFAGMEEQGQELAQMIAPEGVVVHAFARSPDVSDVVRGECFVGPLCAGKMTGVLASATDPDHSGFGVHAGGISDEGGVSGLKLVVTRGAERANRTEEIEVAKEKIIRLVGTHGKAGHCVVLAARSDAVF